MSLNSTDTAIKPEPEAAAPNTDASSRVIDVAKLVDPAACQTMAEVRKGVDELDRILVMLLTRRQGFMDSAARIKPEFSHVRDEARIEQVVSNILAEARLTGLSPDIAEPVWRLLIERCIAHEGVAWKALRA